MRDPTRRNKRVGDRERRDDADMAHDRSRRAKLNVQGATFADLIKLRSQRGEPTTENT